MPGIVTHHAFGLEVYEALEGLIGASASEREAFLLGNQGPDPLFYLKVVPAAEEMRKVGSTMHSNDPARVLQQVHRVFVVAAPTAGASRAYALGFLCHYLLDSTVHPLVYAQQFALCDDGLEGFAGRQAQRIVHATIETELDEYVFTSKLGTTAADVPPHKRMLACPIGVLDGLSQRMAEVVKALYGIDAPKRFFVAAVSVNRMAQRTLDSRGADVAAVAERLGGSRFASEFLNAMSHRGEPRARTPFANDDRIAWPHPYEPDAVFDESFERLYASALDRARTVLPAFARPGFGLPDCVALTAHVNFLGRTVAR